MLGCGCKKCNAVTAWLFLLLGVGYLLANLGVWNFWGIQWYSALFLVIGLCGVAMGHCADCQACCTMPMTSAKPAKSGKKRR